MFLFIFLEEHSPSVLPLMNHQPMEMHLVTSSPSSSGREDSERLVPTAQEFLNVYNEDDKFTIAASRGFPYDSKKTINM